MKNTQTEKRILEVSGNMFFKHGIRSITMDDIANNLGISKKTIYLYYKDKKSLVKSFTMKELKQHEKEMLEIRNKSRDSIDEMIRLMNHLGNFFTRVNPSVFYDLQKFHPESWQSFRQFKDKIVINFVEENLKKGISNNLFRKDIHIKTLARLRIEEVEMGVNPSIFPPEDFRINDVQISLIDHFIYGIVTPKGYKLIEKYKNQHN